MAGHNHTLPALDTVITVPVVREARHPIWPQLLVQTRPTAWESEIIGHTEDEMVGLTVVEMFDRFLSYCSVTEYTPCFSRLHGI
jgi:hypothetical protein